MHPAAISAPRKLFKSNRRSRASLMSALQKEVGWAYRIIGWVIMVTYFYVLIQGAGALESIEIPNAAKMIVFFPLSVAAWVILLLIANHFDCMGDRRRRTK